MPEKEVSHDTYVGEIVMKEVARAQRLDRSCTERKHYNWRDGFGKRYYYYSGDALYAILYRRLFFITEYG